MTKRYMISPKSSEPPGGGTTKDHKSLQDSAYATVGGDHVRRSWCLFRWSIRVKPRWHTVQRKCFSEDFMVIRLHRGEAYNRGGKSPDADAVLTADAWRQTVFTESISFNPAVCRHHKLLSLLRSCPLFFQTYGDVFWIRLGFREEARVR